MTPFPQETDFSKTVDCVLSLQATDRPYAVKTYGQHRPKPVGPAEGFRDGLQPLLQTVWPLCENPS